MFNYYLLVMSILEILIIKLYYIFLLNDDCNCKVH